MFLHHLKCKKVLIIFFATNTGLFTDAKAAINIDGFATETNDRFANDSSFIAHNFDLSGVAIADNGRWITMISENVFLSAHHYFPANGTSVTYYGTNSTSENATTRIIEQSERIGSSDLRIGTINAGLGNDFSFYDYATDDTTFNYSFANANSFNNSPYHLSDAFIFGRSPSNFSTSQDIAVGRNRLDEWFDSVSAAGTVDDAIASAVNASGDGNFLTYEAAVNFGDSGAPMMVSDGNVLTIVGINWFTATVGAQSYNGYSYVGNYDIEIQSYIDANPVPEIRFFSIIFSFLVLNFVILSQRRRRNFVL